MIQQPESSVDQLAVELEELKQLDIDVLVDYCSPGDQRVISEGGQWDFIASTVLDLDSRCLELPPLQQCCDISPGALRLRFLFLLERSETLDR